MFPKLGDMPRFMSMYCVNVVQTLDRKYRLYRVKLLTIGSIGTGRGPISTLGSAPTADP
jgi:hypothetical protein